MMKPEIEKWTQVIGPHESVFRLNIRELWSYRDLVVLLVRRDFVASFKQTVLGPLWFFIQPVLTTVIFTLIFGRLAGLSTDGVPGPLFYLTGIVFWNYFADCLNRTSSTFIVNSSVFGKVYFPRIIIPLSTVLSAFMRFGVQFLLLLAVWIYYIVTDQGLQPAYHALPLIVLVVLISAMLAMGGGMIISGLTTKYRDLQQLVGFGIQLLMYVSPVIFPASLLTGKLKTLLMLNPMSGLINTMRFVFCGNSVFSWTELLYPSLIAILVLFSGIVVFNKAERTFIDTV
jgi:lipopolysaccharide transport system permease protein